MYELHGLYETVTLFIDIYYIQDAYSHMVHPFNAIIFYDKRSPYSISKLYTKIQTFREIDFNEFALFQYT